MRVLCLDTSGPTVVVAILETDDGSWSGEVAEVRAQALLEVVERVLDGDRSIHAIAVGLGPGGFTGLRVGITTARGLATALGVPLHGFSSLLAVAAPAALDQRGRTVRADVDARRGERFVQEFRADEDGRIAEVSAARAVAAGPGTSDGDVDAISVAGVALAALQALDAADPAGDPFAVLPQYVRAPDAEPARMRIAVDPLRVADLDALVELDRRSFSMPWSRQMFEAEFARPEREAILLAARDLGRGGRLVGAALGAWIGDSWHVMTMAVDPAARRRGIAAQLLDELLEQGEERGQGQGWTLEVRVGNAAAIALYGSHGFASHGVRPRYYADSGEDALVMWRRPSTAGTADAGQSGSVELAAGGPA